MANLPLHEFIGVNREELVRRCREKVAKRSAPAATKAEIDHGVPTFLDQLVKELRQGSSQTHAIIETACQHGHDLLLQGFTVDQVVHDYGDVCQSVTDLAVKTGAEISADDFRTMNRCLDNAIAGAVSAHALEQESARNGTSSELRNLTNAAITAFEVVKSGRVGVGGGTAAVVHRSLMAILAVLDRPSTATAEKPPGELSNAGRS